MQLPIHALCSNLRLLAIVLQIALLYRCGFLWFWLFFFVFISWL